MIYKIDGVFVLLAASLFLGQAVRIVSADCQPETGPSGNLECIRLFSYYLQSQWATCLTNTYIQLISRGRHSCINETAKYCYYQCMLEVHGADGGSVSSDCSCTPGDVAPATQSPQPEIPEWCGSPDGNNCSFYRECVEKRYPCSDGRNAYALSYGEKFCNLYKEQYTGITAIGQEWIDAVQKCLQVALVPLLRPFENPTCNDIARRAFGSFTNCYVEANNGAPSVCDIGFENWMKVMATVNPTLDVLDDFGTSLITLAQSFQVMWECSKVMGSWNSPLPVVRMKFERTGYYNSLTIDIVRSAYATAAQVRDLIWRDQNIKDIFIYPFIVGDPYRKGQEIIVEVDLLIVPRVQYDLDYTGNEDVNVSAVIEYLLDQVEAGKFTPNVIEKVSLNEYIVCYDYSCTVPSRVAQEPQPSPGSTSNGQSLLISSIVSLFASITPFIF